MLNKRKENYLKKRYYDPLDPASFGGITKFYKCVKDNKIGISKSDVLKWLQSQETYSSHSEVKRKK
jgi:hypothetical protein